MCALPGEHLASIHNWRDPNWCPEVQGLRTPHTPRSGGIAFVDSRNSHYRFSAVTLRLRISDVVTLHL